MNDMEYEEKEQGAILMWKLSTIIAIVSLVSLIAMFVIAPEQKQLIVGLLLVALLSAGYSLYLGLFYVSGFIWQTVRQINPVITLVAVVIFPLLLIPIVIGMLTIEGSE
ncbi:MAG: hypothetical protein PSN44_07660 [Gammaproteobacteria bacterium]|nr:hypothetical protein [Gammaproteobacteria bacterium]